MMQINKNRIHTYSLKPGAEAGQALIMFTLGMTFLLGMLGLVIDVGYGYFVKQVAQAAADSAALAAATAASESGGSCGGAVLCQGTATNCPPSPTKPPSTNFDVACLYAKVNGFVNSGAQTVTISSGTGTPPSSPGVNNAAYWVTVTASQQQYLGFLSALGLHGGLISAQATGAVLAGTGAGGCIYVLAPTGSAMNVSGSANIFSNCGIYVDSSAGNALISSGSAKTIASVVDVVGNVNISGGSTVTPRPTTGVAPVADPLANLPAPAFSGCRATNKSISVITTSLDPGVYCGGVTISGGANVTFNSGSYILNGGGLSVSGNSTITGTGVFFYNTSSGYIFKPIMISGDTTMALTAPTSGTYQGILFFQDRSIFSSASSSFSGGSTANVSGTIYLPSGVLYFSGGASTAPLTMALVCKGLNVSGNAYLAKDPTGELTGMTSVSSTALVQ
jgi:Flp pilus assembly protein TadG